MNLSWLTLLQRLDGIQSVNSRIYPAAWPNTAIQNRKSHSFLQRQFPGWEQSIAFPERRPCERIWLMPLEEASRRVEFRGSLAECLESREAGRASHHHLGSKKTSRTHGLMIAPAHTKRQPVLNSGTQPARECSCELWRHRPKSRGSDHVQLL